MCKSLSSINDWQVMFNMGEDVSEERAKEKIREADLDGDGRVAVIFQENLCVYRIKINYCNMCELHSFLG